MDGQPSFVSYISHMRNPHVWVGTPMLHAASAVLGLQIVCFMGSPEPSIIAAPNVLSQAESPVAVIANVGNWHFYALEPDNPTYDVEPLDLGSADDALLAWSANSSLHEWQDNIANVTEAECSRSYGAPESHTEYDAQLFKLGESLMSADLFGNITCDQELSQLVASQDASDASNVDDNCFMVLRWRDAVKFSQWETADQQNGVNRDYEYQIGKAYYSCASSRHGEMKIFEKSRRLLENPDFSNISAALEQPCEKHGARHTCLDAFRAVPHSVLRWRKMFYNLPKVDCEQRLQDM